jgi:hypothetical protein
MEPVRVAGRAQLRLVDVLGEDAGRHELIAVRCPEVQAEPAEAVP